MRLTITRPNAKVTMSTEATIATRSTCLAVSLSLPDWEVMGSVFCARSACEEVVSTSVTASAVPPLLEVDVGELPPVDDVDEGPPVVVGPLTLTIAKVEVVVGASVTDAAVNAERVGGGPRVRGLVSRNGRSDCWNRIWRAGPTVNLPSRLVAPQTPPRKSVVSVVHV